MVGSSGVGISIVALPSSVGPPGGGASSLVGSSVGISTVALPSLVSGAVVSGAVVSTTDSVVVVSSVD